MERGDQTGVVAEVSFIAVPDRRQRFGVEAIEAFMIGSEHAAISHDGSGSVRRELGAMSDGSGNNPAGIAELVKAGAVVFSSNEDTAIQCDRRWDIEVAADGRDKLPEAGTGLRVPSAQRVLVIANDLISAAKGAANKGAV